MCAVLVHGNRMSLRPLHHTDGTFFALADLQVGTRKGERVLQHRFSKAQLHVCGAVHQPRARLQGQPPALPLQRECSVNLRSNVRATVQGH